MSPAGARIPRRTSAPALATRRTSAPSGVHAHRCARRGVPSVEPTGIEARNDGADAATARNPQPFGFRRPGDAPRQRSASLSNLEPDGGHDLLRVASLGGESAECCVRRSTSSHSCSWVRKCLSLPLLMPSPCTRCADDRADQHPPRDRTLPLRRSAGRCRALVRAAFTDTHRGDAPRWRSTARRRPGSNAPIFLQTWVSKVVRAPSRGQVGVMLRRVHPAAPVRPSISGESRGPACRAR